MLGDGLKRFLRCQWSKQTTHQQQSYLARGLEQAKSLKIWMGRRGDATTTQRSRDIETIRASGLFNTQWYLDTYHDVADQGHDPIDHFLRHGWQEGRNPNSIFHTSWYLDTYPDVLDAKICPLLHYLAFGTPEDRQPNAIFSNRWYLKRYPEIDASNMHPLVHYEQVGSKGGFDPHPYFNTAWLNAHLAKRITRHPNALAAYFDGELEDIDPTPSLDARWYRETVAGIARTSPHVACDYANRLPSDQAARNRSEQWLNTMVREQLLGKSPSPMAAMVSGETALRVVVGIVGYDNSDGMLQRCFRSCKVALARAGLSEDSIILFVENGSRSPRDTIDKLATRMPSKGNMGFGCGHNYLMNTAFSGNDTSHYLALNPDAILAPDCILNLLQMSLATNNNALLEALQYPDEHPKVYDMTSLDTPWASGACMLISKRLYSTLGGFDPDFFMYCEDVDLSWRARAAGFSVKTCPRALVYHPTAGRCPSEREHKQFLNSGYVLAQKWGDASFMKRMKDEYAFSYPAERPTWSNTLTKHVTRGSGIANFARLFHFADVRW